MKLKEGDKDIPDSKVRIYAETAKQILDQCFINAEKVINTTNKLDAAAKKRVLNGNKFSKLENALALSFYNVLITDIYLRTKARELGEIEKKNLPYQTIGFDHPNIFVLAQFAGFDDYTEIDRKYAPLIDEPVLFTLKPFNFFSLIRVPEQGCISKNENQLIYVGKNLKITGDVTEAEPFTMPGDKLPLWIKVKYKTNGNEHIAYFSENVNSPIQPVSVSGKLMVFFRNMKSLASFFSYIVSQKG